MGPVPTSRYTAPADVLAAELEGELVLLEPASGVYFSLNRSGSRIWQWLQRGATLDELLREMEETFGLSAEQAGSDLLPFLATLREQGLLREGAP